jgi:hypothetical protein
LTLAIPFWRRYQAHQCGAGPWSKATLALYPQLREKDAAKNAFGVRRFIAAFFLFGVGEDIAAFFELRLRQRKKESGDESPHSKKLTPYRVAAWPRRTR